MSCRPRFATLSGNQNATRAPLFLSWDYHARQ